MYEGQPATLVLSGVRGDTQRYRSFHTYEQLKLAGVPCELSHLTDPGLPARFDRADLVILHRVAFDGYVEHLVRRARDRGGMVISDVDDLVFDPAAFRWIDSPDFQDPLRVALYQEEMERYRTTLETCQAVTCSTRFLAAQVSALGKSSWIHRNGYSMEMLALSEAALRERENHDPAIVIGYASGTHTHDRDFEVAKPAIRQVLERYPQVELWLVGPLDPGEDWGTAAERVRRIKRVPWRRLPEIQAQFDINLAPLVMDNPFGQSKSEIKYMEGALVGVPTVASPTGAFAHAIRPGDNGFLAAKGDEWAERLSGLIEDASLRRTIADRARKDVLDRYNPSTRASELIATINRISTSLQQRPLWDEAAVSPPRSSRGIQYGSPEGSVSFDRQVMEPPSVLQMALYSLRHRGVRTMLLQMRVYLRRLAASLIPYSSDPRNPE